MVGMDEGAVRQDRNDQALKKAYLALKKAHARLSELEDAQRESIAIVGMACRFPGGADTPGRFWDLLAGGVDAISEAPPGRWAASSFYSRDPAEPGKMYTVQGGFLREPVDAFDAPFFNISPREARALDPQQRLLLEVAWEAVENAGVPADKLKGGNGGVFVGVSGDDYALGHRHSHDFSRIDAYSITGTTPSTAAGRLSYFFGWEGPAMALDTACSSSLVAVHLACQSLRQRESDFALAGGVNLILTPDSHVCFSKLQALSPDGKCRAFDAAANGYVRGEGCGLIILKRLSDAIAGGDRILALIRSTAVNQDGKSNGLTAPNGVAQQKVIRQALARGRISPTDISYVEAHGTGTALGDPIEMEAIGEELAAGRTPENPLLVGSVKTNVGHLESAAGMAGLLKVVLALQRESIPPTLHFREPSPHIPWANLAVRVPTQMAPWPRGDRPRLAGLSSFGFSGTNSHIILQEAPSASALPAPAGARPVQTLNLSARNPAALRALARAFAERLETAPDSETLGDLCHSANTGRSFFERRLALSAESKSEAARRLRAFAAGESSPAICVGESRPGAEPRVVFLFTGQGAQYVGMGRALYAREPVFRTTLDECDARLRPWLGESIIDLMHGGDPARLNQTRFAQPAIFALECGLCQMLRGWGLRPAAVMGHSLGEYAAAFAAGVFSLGDGLKMVAMRARLMQELPQNGAMRVVFAPEAEVAAALRPRGDRVAIASLNGPANTVISGEAAAVAEVAAELAGAGVTTRPLAVSHAFHSRLLDPMLDEFERIVAELPLAAPQFTLISNLTGKPVREECRAAAYWRRHARQPVRFADGLSRLREQGHALFLELGPKPDLLSMARRFLPEETILLPTLRENDPAVRQLYLSLASLSARGVSLDWAAFDQDRGYRRVPLPNYPFQRQRYWALGAPVASRADENLGHPLFDRVTRSPLLDVVLFEGECGLETRPWLADHRVFGEIVVSGACLLAATLGAAARSLGAGPLACSDVFFQKALTIPTNESRRLQLALPSGAGPGVFRLLSATAPDAADGVIHFSGAIQVIREAKITPDGHPSRSAADAWRRLERTVAAEAVYELQSKRQIELGPSYRWIDAVKTGGAEAVARLRSPVETGAPGGWPLPPGLIDSCFGLAVMTLNVSVEDSFVPFAIEAFTFHAPANEGNFWAYARRRESLGGKLVADVWLTTETGQPVAEMIGLEGRAASRSQMLADAAGSIHDCFYTVEWREQSLSQPPARSAASPAELKIQLQATLDRLIATPEMARYGQGMAELERLVVAYAAAALADLGELPATGSNLSALEAAERLGVAPRHQKLWRRLLEALAAAGLVTVDGERQKAFGEFTAVEPASAARALGERFPECAAELALVERCGAALASVLRGECDPLKELLFPNGDATRVARVYREGLAGRSINALVHEAALALIERVPAPETIRILEIGAGSGGTTAELLPRLPATRVSYAFTDLSPKFLADGRASFGRHDFVRFARLDIEQDPSAQGFQPGEYHLIIAANVVHATADLRQTLCHIRSLLAPGGFLLLAEGIAPALWLDLVFGMTEGWWRFKDLALRPTHPLLAAERWGAILEQSGFARNDCVTLPAESRHAISQQAVIIAQAGAASAVPPVSRRRWLIFTDRGPTGARLATTMESAGYEVLTAVAGGGFQRISERGYELDPQVASHFDRLVAAAQNPDSPLTGVAYLWGLDAPGPASFGEAGPGASSRPGWSGALRLAQALARAKFARAPRLWFVTRDAVNTGADGLSGLAQSPLAGLSNAIAGEAPEFSVSVVDLDPAARDGAQNLFAELSAATPEVQIAWRGSRRFVARLTRSVPPAAPSAVAAPTREWRVRADRTYLITGGFGGLGLQTAKWLVEHGARHLALAGRRDPGPAAQVKLEALAAAGAEVTVFTADVSRFAQTAGMLTEIRRELPALAGIFHCAGVVDNAALAEQDDARFENVMAAKVDGAWLLHQLTEALELDCFVLFSSAASVLSAPGQANYAAANAFLDALAQFRRAQGRPVTCVNWGAWADVGAAAEAPSGAMLRLKGLSPLTPAAGFAALERALVERLPQVCVLVADWPVYLAHAPASPFLSELAPRTPSLRPTPAPASPTLDFAAWPAPERSLRLERYLTSRVALVLGWNDDAAVDPGQGFFEMGMDSLTSVELRNRLQTELKRTLPTTLALDYPTVFKLAEYLARELVSPPPSAARAPTPFAASATAADVRQMSDAEAERLLEQELAALKLRL